MAALTDAVMKALYAVLSGSVEITGQLAKYTPPGGIEGPAIFEDPAPAGAGYPKVITRGDTAYPDETTAADRMNYVIDVYDENESASRSDKIASQVERAMINARPSIEGQTFLVILRDFRGRVIEDEPSIKHVHLEFLVRYGRDDLY